METIPTEIHSVIISFLDDKSKRKMRLANTQWFNRIRYNNFKFYHTTSKQLPQILDRLSKYSFSIGVTFKEQGFMLTKENCKAIGRLMQLTKFRAQTLVPTDILHPFTNLTNLVYLAYHFPTEVMQHLTSIRKLFLESNDPMTPHLARFTKLESVEWHNEDEENRDQPDPLPILQNAKGLTQLYLENVPKVDESRLTRFTNLKYLELALEERTVDLPHLPNLETLSVRVRGSGNINLVSPYGDTLTELTLMNIQSLHLPSLQAFTRLKSFYLSWENSSNICSQEFYFLTALTNLEYLCLSPAENQVDDWSKKLEFLCLDKLTALVYYGSINVISISTLISNLRSLEVDTLSGMDSLPNLEKLTSLKVAKFQKEKLPLLESMTNLKSLRVGPHTNMEAADFLHLDKLIKLENLQFYHGLAHHYNSPPLLDGKTLQHLPLTRLHYALPIKAKIFEDLAVITTLKDIALQLCLDLTDDLVKCLTSLTNLARLRIQSPSNANNSFTGVTCTLLTSLHTLHLSCKKPENFISREMLRQKMTQLVHVNKF